MFVYIPVLNAHRPLTFLSHTLQYFHPCLMPPDAIEMITSNALR